MTIGFIEECIRRARNHDSGIDVGVLGVPGFSTGVMRRLWNNLASGAAVYLEVGAYFGGTACAALNNNPDLMAYFYEDGSQEFHGLPILEDLRLNLETFGSHNWVLREEDFFSRNVAPMPDADFFFYDGNHAREFQAKALPHAFPQLASRFLFAVDDFNWESVRKGTEDALIWMTLGKAEIVHSWHLRGQKLQDDPVWHNGVALYLCEKCPTS
jgi:hypothetical protein